MSLLQRSDGIFVAGHNGLFGSAIVNELRSLGYSNIITAPRSELDLCDETAVKNFFEAQKPKGVILAAAKVGGILANNQLRADFIYQNLQIQNNVIWQAHINDVQRLIFLGSSCIYPREASQPIKESSLLTAPLEYTNRPYAIAKIAGMELVDSLRKQYNRDYFSVMPTNLYGPKDNYHPKNSHVLPALIRRFSEAKRSNQQEVVVWGSGKPLREFMHSTDAAKAVVHLYENLPMDYFTSIWSHINIGSGHEISIKDLSFLISKIIGYEGKITFDESKPDGTMKKHIDSSMLKALGFTPSVELEAGIRMVVKDYEREHLQKM